MIFNTAVMPELQNLTMDLNMYSQNRPRFRRLALSSAHRWEEMYLSFPTKGVPHQAISDIHDAISRRRWELMLDGLLAGFDLELFDDLEEIGAMYWWIGQITREWQELLPDMEEEGECSWRDYWIAGWGNAAHGVLRVSSLGMMRAGVELTVDDATILAVGLEQSARPIRPDVSHLITSYPSEGKESSKSFTTRSFHAPYETRRDRQPTDIGRCRVPSSRMALLGARLECAAVQSCMSAFESGKTI